MKNFTIAGLLITTLSCSSGIERAPSADASPSTMSGAASSNKKNTIKQRYDEKSGATLVYDSSQPEIHTCKDELFKRLPKQWQSEGRWLDRLKAVSRRDVLKNYRGIHSDDIGLTGYEYYDVSGCLEGNGMLGCSSWVNALIVVHVKSHCRAVKRFLEANASEDGSGFYELVDSLPTN